MNTTPNGQRKCEECTFYHPERPKRPCSAFGQLENKQGDCSMYIEDLTPAEERVRWS